MSEIEIDTHQKISGNFADMRGMTFVMLGRILDTCQYDILGL